MTVELRRRQIHLDFHTSPAIREVGADFDPETFGDILARTHVNSVTCFAKCHHGLFYYDSEVGPRHPGLGFDLLARMIDSCHARDIRVPAYVSVQFDEHAARTHPEWRQVTSEGQLAGPIVGEAAGGAWPTLCIHTGYREYLARTIEELVKGYEIDGVFLDICMDQESCSEAALEKMRSDGLDADEPEDRRRFARKSAIVFLKEFYTRIQRLRRGLPVFFNGRVDMGMRDSLRYLTHVEVESLPTGGWGYDHFQRMGRYVRNLGSKPFLGMTARFHKSWADFGTLKTQGALEYETLTAIAHGGGVSIGDQLHPRGALEPAVYDRIGLIYAKIRDLEPYLERARPVTQIGVLSLCTNPAISREQAIESDRGATAILNETHHLFDLLDGDSSFEDYALLVLPDQIAPEPDLVDRLARYLKNGGRILVTGTSLLDNEASRFALGSRHGFAARFVGHLDYCPFYMRMTREFGGDLPAIDHCMYEPGVRMRAEPKAVVAARVVVPYFNRTAEHYCSHFQTPAARATRDPAIVLTGRTAYINTPVFAAYARHGNVAYRQMVSACLDRLLPDRVIRTSLPSPAQVSVLDQRIGRRHRRIVHLLYYPVARRAGALEIIDEPGELNRIAVELACPGRVTAVEGVPQHEPIPFEQNERHVRFVIPRIQGHQAICVTEQR